MSKQEKLSRRSFLRMSAIAATGGLLAACAPPAPEVVKETVVVETEVEVEVEKEVPVEVTRRVKEEAEPEAASLAFWSEAFSEWVPSRLEAYAGMNPLVDVEYVTLPWGEMTTKLLTATAGGTPPNLVIQDRFLMAGWSSRGGVLALDDYIAQYKVNPEDYYPATWEEATWDGHVYAIPLKNDGRFVFWNKDLFEAAGLDPETPPPTHDWEAMIETAVKLTKEDASGLVETMGFVPSQVLSNAYGNGGDYVYVWANGGEYMKDKYTAWMDNPKIVETLQWQIDIGEAVGGIEKTAEFSAGWPDIAGFSPFGAGVLAIMVSGDWCLRQFADYYPDVNFGMTPWHVRGSETETTGISGGHCLAVPAGAESLLATYQLLSFLHSPDSMLNIALQGQQIPCLKSVALSDEVISDSPYPELRRMANESLQYSRYRAVTPVAQEIHNMWCRPGTARDWALYGEKTAQQACDDMQQIVQKALDDYWMSVS